MPTRARASTDRTTSTTSEPELIEELLLEELRDLLSAEGVRECLHGHRQLLFTVAVSFFESRRTLCGGSLFRVTFPAIR